MGWICEIRDKYVQNSFFTAIGLPWYQKFMLLCINHLIRPLTFFYWSESNLTSAKRWDKSDPIQGESIVYQQYLESATWHTGSKCTNVQRNCKYTNIKEKK